MNGLTRYVLIEKKPFWVEVDYSDVLKYSRTKTHLVKHHPNKRYYEAIRDDEEGLLFLEKKYCKILKEPE